MCLLIAILLAVWMILYRSLSALSDGLSERADQCSDGYWHRVKGVERDIVIVLPILLLSTYFVYHGIPYIMEVRLSVAAIWFVLNLGLQWLVHEQVYKWSVDNRSRFTKEVGRWPWQ